jgi:hypothetical protein
MTLVTERRLADFIDPPRDSRVLEASGVLSKGGYYGGRRIAVVSLQTARLGVGTRRIKDWTIGDRGTIYDFPRTRKGKSKYCTLEGLYWLSETTFVMVSDLSKAGYGKRCGKRDQSIHIFRIPRAKRH